MSLNLPANIFSRIETLKKWQEEQQLKLLKQQSEQQSFLNNEQERLDEALAVSTPKARYKPNSNSACLRIVAEDNPSSTANVDDQPIKCPRKNFSELLEERLKQDDFQEQDVAQAKPKRDFLRKGSGLVRYNLTPASTKHQKVEKKRYYAKPRVRFEANDKEEKCKSDEHSWAAILEQQQNKSYRNIFDGSLEQKAFELQLERELQVKRDIEELRLFEILEQKAKNSSFCSTNSTITRLISEEVQCIQSTGDWSLGRLSSSQSSTSETSASEGTVSSPESSGCCTPVVQICNVAVNTEIPYPNVLNEEYLVRERLGQLEREIETFREENNKSALQRQQAEREAACSRSRLEDERQKLEEERRRLAREKAVVNRNSNGSSSAVAALRRERDDLRVQLTTVTEELKVKETRYGAAQARYRNQLRSLEKENAALKSQNETLLKQNSRLQATLSMNKRRTPSDTKVLHEINKNLSKLTIRDTKKPTKDDKENTGFDLDVTDVLKKLKDRTCVDESDQEFKFNSPLRCVQKSDDAFVKLRCDYERTFGDDDTLTKGAATEMALSDGAVCTTYSNGNIRTISKNGGTVTMSYYNGDVKESNLSTGTVRYYYKEAGTWHTSYGLLEGGPLEVLEFPNGQIEKRRPDGSSEVSFPDGSVTCVSPNGTERTSFTDGTELIADGRSRILTLPNGQREIHTDDHKRREYPDGTVKLLYPDGTQETRYANGRIRVKDCKGHLVVDTQCTD